MIENERLDDIMMKKINIYLLSITCLLHYYLSYRNVDKGALRENRNPMLNDENHDVYVIYIYINQPALLSIRVCGIGVYII